MSKNTLHNSREKRQFNTWFSTLKQIIQRFSSGLLSAQVLALALCVAIFFIHTPAAQSKRQLPVTFGSDVSLNVFPTDFETEDWSGVEHVLVQDLDENALFQDFSARNSAYVPLPVVFLPEDSVPAAQTTASSTTNNAPNGLDAQPAESVPDSETPVSVDATSSVSVHPSSLLTSPMALVTRLFPLASLTNTTTTETVELIAPVDDAPVAEDVSDIQPPESELLLNTAVEPVPVEVLASSTPDNASVTSTTELASVLAPTTTELISATSSQSSIEESVASETLTTMSEQTPSASSTATGTAPALARHREVHEITLRDFDLPPLETGQFVTSMQLRVSLAGKLKEIAPSDRVPYLEVLFGTSTSLREVGVVLLDDEISNAINGGYFLFALPDDYGTTELAATEVVIRYHGNNDDLEGLFLDAVWLELETKVITEDDIKARGKAENLKGLKAPKLTELVSEQINFKRDEMPIFNLRYASQQNFLVRSIRNLLGKDAVLVENVTVRHRTLGLLGIKPEVSVTKDGLLTIQFPDEFRRNLRPGSYEIEMTLREGGKVNTDTFDFQWGVLAMNPSQSEYEIGDTVDISIGALTPSGHTVCEANLDLYVTDPDGMVTRVPVEESGLCDGNNVVDVPDFMARTTALVPGEHKLYLERLGDDGEVLSFTDDSFLVTPFQRLSIHREGPTRIYPPASYPMTLTVDTKSSFSGTLTERVPTGFKITDTTADIVTQGEWQILTWDLSILGEGSKSVSYQFDAPDISPYLYNLGPASLQEESQTRTITVASTTASTSEMQTIVEGGALFSEHRQWQIASDAIGNMLLFWDDGASVPAGWTCVSCTGGDPFFQKFIMGSSTYNTTGGATVHNHSADGSVIGSSAVTTDTKGGSTIAGQTHEHTLTPQIEYVSNLPEYRQLRVIEYTAAAGEPATIPQGAIAIFDVASSSLPTNWNRYATQDGRYVYGENTVGTTGGSNTHSHAATGTTGTATGGTPQGNSGPDQADGAAASHTHTINSTSDTVNNEPPYVSVLLAQAAADVSPTNGIIAMWTEDVDGGWLNLSDEPGDPFTNNFIKPATSYGSTGGSLSHTHTDITGVLSSVPSAIVTTAKSGSAGSDSTHQHSVSVTNFSSDSHLPPYVTAVFGKRQGTDPVYEQMSSRWYVNKTTSQTPDDPWPQGATDLVEQEPITATSTPVKYSDEVRLRMNLGVTNATSTAGAAFTLQYAAAAVCSAATSWFAVGDEASTTPWRGFDNGSVSDHSTLSTTLLASSTVSATYEENGYATSTPNDIAAGAYGEWDFVLQHNGADDGTNYCFRLVEEDGTPLSTYTHYPQLYTNESPTAPTLSGPFDNEKTATTTPWFYFVSVDTEGEAVHYQIQIDNNYDFSSPLVDNQTDDEDEDDAFKNQVLYSEKAAFTEGNLIGFKPTTTMASGTTYYWHVRALDAEGSNAWGDWSEIRSVTIDPNLIASAWFQTENEQFDTNTLSGVETGSNAVALISGSTSGSMISAPIDFTDGADGTAWGSLTFTENDSGDVLDYQVQYLTESDTWALIPDADLAGNSSGFPSSPVSLLTLDTDTYTVIRIVANFTANTGTPTLQDWTVKWGYRVETPTITKLFPNEQTGTTTPTLEFTTTDPQDDGLTYEVQWSLTPDFTASTTRNSTTTPTGFVNIDNGGNSDPFFSGDTIQYTIQSADALTGTTTYWWRVRAKDSGLGGDDAWSFWTEPQSFTVIPGTQVSTWFQTTQEQFDTDILSGTVSLTNDAVAVATTASEAMIVYGEGTQNTPRYRQWNGTTLSAEGSLQGIEAPLKWAVVRAGTTREEYVAATIGADSDVNVQVFSTGAWGNLTELTTSVGDSNARGVDVAYETLSGNAMVAYCDGNTGEADYYIWNGSSWSAGTGITLASGDPCEWIQLASDPVSNEIIILMRDSTGGQYEAQVWNGSAWGNSTTQGGITEDAHEGMAVMYEESGNQAVIVTSDGNPARFRWNTWNGTTWGTAQTQTIGDDLEWAQLVRDVGSDVMALCYQDEDIDVGVIRWSGSAWVTPFTELDLDGNAKNDPAFSCVYEDTSGRNGYIMAAVSNTTQTEYHDWDTTGWTAQGQINSITNSPTAQLIRTGTANVLGILFDSTNALRFTTWDGSGWSTTTNMETDASVDTSPYGHPYFMAPRNPGREGTTVVSPAIDFDDGLGPYWKTFSWNDTQPGSSEILYHLQYQTATGSWAFIPDSVLPDNVAGTTTGPFDLSGLNTNTYNVIRPYAEMTCDGSFNCPQLYDWKIEWAGGITISGTAQQYDESINVTPGTSVSVAVNGVLQTGKTGSVGGGGNWSIDNVTVFAGDIVTVFFNGVADANEAVGVTRYDGQGDIDGMVLYERHVTLGSNDATTTPLTNADIAQYDVTNTEDVFFDLVNGTTLQVCADTGCGDAELHILPGTYYTPTGRLLINDFENKGTFTAGAYVHEVSGSWVNSATTTMTGSTIVFAATSTTESINSIGAVSGSFNNVTFGTSTGSGVWTLANALDVNGNLTVARGTLARGTTSITVARNLATESTGFWTGLGTTTFDGSVAATWSDQNTTEQNIGYAVIDGSPKTVTLATDVTAQSVTIGANDTLDAAAAGNHDITVYGNWTNHNNFLPRSGEVFFAATSTGVTITTAGDAFYDLTFTGIGGEWSLTESTLLVNNDLTIATGTVNLPANGTTTIDGSFDATGGSFAHGNGTLYFTSDTAGKQITFDGGLFTNVARNLTFNGGGSWTITDTNATTTNDLRIEQGTVLFPSGVLAIGGTLTNAAGTFVGGSGTTLFYSSGTELITTGGSSFGTVVFDGTGVWSFAGTNVIAGGDLLVQQGTLTMPSGTFTVAGSYDNNATVAAGTGTVIFTGSGSDETVAFGDSALYNVTFNTSAGQYTIIGGATTTNDLLLIDVGDFDANGQLVSVGGVFTNAVGASTTWAGSTLSLEAGVYSINSKSDAGDAYGTLRIAADTDIKMWNSVATTYVVDASGSLYSQDHNAVPGNLYIWGDYHNDGGIEYWSHATDFDGADLTGSERIANVRFAAGATASFASSTLEILGGAGASTTIAAQGANTYTLSVSGGTTSARYYEFSDLGLSGLSLLGATHVTQLRDGYYEVGINNGAAITVSSSTIDANPVKQIYNVTFATTTAISATNTQQIGDAPASFWWFREGHGNLYGENYDNDTGNPGSIRFDDSAVEISISGTVYSDGGVTPITGGTCNNAAVIDVMVDGVLATSTACSSSDGSYTAYGVTVVGDPTITIFLNDAPGGERGSVITRTPTGNLTGVDIYANRVIVRNEDTEPLTIANLAVYDSSNDTDLQFTAATSSVGDDTLVVSAGNELHVFASSTFTPGGVVTLAANAGNNSYDGTLYVAADATFNAFSTSTLTVGGRLVLESGAVFDAATTTVLMTATTAAKSITATDLITFKNLVFNGSGGEWTLGADIQVDGDMTITAGTVQGNTNITLPTGSLTGNGVLSLGGAGTTTLGRSNSLGGTSAWSFYNLKLGDGIVAGTTTPLFTSTTTVSGWLRIAAAHFLDAGSTVWDLAGTGNVFYENGTFLEDTSTIRYSGGGANVLSTQYYNLAINGAVGTPTYIVTGLGLIVDGNLTVGGEAPSTFDLFTNDPYIDVNSDVSILANGTLSANPSNVFTIGGNYDNNGVFTHNNGLLTFDTAGTASVWAGTSDFASVVIDATGDLTVAEHATATTAWTLQNANDFTLATNQVLAVGGAFFNVLNDSATVWDTNSVLRLYGGGNYSINASTSTDSYATLAVDGTTQIRMWNSEATTYLVDSTASLYSQDHANNPGDLYIWGEYKKLSGTDYWSHATDFDGTTLGAPRKVDVFVATSSSVSYLGGSLLVAGADDASTTVQALGLSTYSLMLGSGASTTWNYYELRDLDVNGLVLTGSVHINDLSRGDIIVSQNTGTGITVGGNVLTNNAAQTYYFNRFELQGVATGTNVTATGSALSSWRFENHYGGLDGEDYDVDPGSPPTGDPGYIVWDNSTSTITISGHVYSDEGTNPSSVCQGTAAVISLYVNNSEVATVDCDGAGYYSISDISYSANQSVIAYISTTSSQKGAVVTVDLVSDVSNFDIYENRLIVRHEASDPLTNTELAVRDSTKDSDILFTVTGGDLVMPQDTKLIVWDNKEFAPGGDVTLTNGGSQSYGGTLELQDDATWTGAGSELLSIGGSFLSGTGATFSSSNGTTTFTTSGAGRTIDVNEDAFHNVAFTGTGSWTVTGPTLTTTGYLLQTAGDLTFGGGTTTVAGSFVSSGGAFTINGSPLVLAGTGSHQYLFGGSDVAALEFAAGTYIAGDTNATATASVSITNGAAITLPSGIFTIGGDFINYDGSLTHNSGELLFTNATVATLQASSSDLYAATFNGGGAYSIADQSISFLGDLFITNGSLALASGTTAIGGSFDATGGTFTHHATATVLFNSADAGEFIDPGVSSFYNVQISAPAGGYTLVDSATTTNNFYLASAGDFTVQSGAVLTVGGVFSNTVVDGSNTDWEGSTLKLDGANAYEINTKSLGGDQYDTLIVGANSDLRFWGSAATTTIVDPSSSVYSQDHAGNAGDLYIFGDFHIGTTTEYWSYATDFDGAALGGSSRPVTVAHAANATTTLDGGVLQVVGASGNETTITNQGSGTYALRVTDGTFLAQYYALRNLNSTGLYLAGTPTIASLSYGDYELAVNGGSLITLSSTTLNANASLVITGNRFATTTAITGYNVTVVGTTSNAWTYTSHTGNLDGEDFDVDGITACGSVRWNDSACLLIQQTSFRWRNDDGGLAVPNSEWYHGSWDARQMIRIDNADATAYTDVAVRLLVPYDSDMRSDFYDLRFTDSSGTTLIPFWIGSTTASALAEVWVQVPTLPAEDQAVVYMYYNSPSVSTTSSSASDTFIAADDFEDGNVSEYSGETVDFNVDGSFAYDGSNGLEASDVLGQTESGGMYRLDQTVSTGTTMRFRQYVNTSYNDETCVLFGIQSSGAPGSNYGYCLDLNGTDRIVLSRDAVDSANSPAVTLDSQSVSLTTGWYDFEVDWTTSGLDAYLYDSTGTEVATLTSSDTTYDSGGYGFTYWYQHGGWDSFMVRPTLTTEPTVHFGAEQTDGGASWKAAENTKAAYNVNDVARLRVVVENSGLPVTNRQFLLEYAPLASSPSCEAVSEDDYNPVPVQASCSGQPVCMQDSMYVTNGAATIDLLTDVNGDFVAGEARENTTNITGNIDIDQGEYTELEYVITPTADDIDENLCFRVTHNGSFLDTYLSVAELQLRFDPSLTNVTLNDGYNISLLPGTTTQVYATGTVTDLNGYTDIVSATTTFYRSGVAGGAACTPDNNNCYQTSVSAGSCSFTDCAGDSCTIECIADMYFHAEPTATGTAFEGQDWYAFTEVEDSSAGYDFATSFGVDVEALRAIEVFGLIDYGALVINSDTGTDNASTTVYNEGNMEVNLEITGTALSDGYTSSIDAKYQKFATSTFDYSLCGGACDTVSSTEPKILDVELAKPTVETPPVEDEVYWGIFIPIGVNSAPHQGVNVFTPIDP